MTPREYMLKPTGSQIVENAPSEQHLRFLHWVGYWPERIDGQRQTANADQAALAGLLLRDAGSRTSRLRQDGRRLASARTYHKR